MQKILITGNGFDLNIGLPTSYNDFIEILKHVNSEPSISFDSVYSNSSNYENILENFRKFNLDVNKINELDKKAEKNTWFQFFKNEYEIESWIDFENKIEYVLNTINSAINDINNKIFSKGSMYLSQNNFNFNFNFKLFNNKIDMIKILETFKLITVSITKNIKIDIDFLISKHNYYINLDIKKITDYLYSELNDFKIILNDYFEIFVCPFYNNLKKIYNKELFSLIGKHYTFNYTPTFEKLFSNTKNTRYLHGKINPKKNELVLGVNELPPSDIDKRYFIPFTKYYQKLYNNTDYKFLHELDRIQNVNYEFYFWGHSLDKSDADYINEVFEFLLNNNSKDSKIIIVYHNESSRAKLLINLLFIRGKDEIQKLMKEDKLVFLKNNSKELINQLKNYNPYDISVKVL